MLFPDVAHAKIDERYFAVDVLSVACDKIQSVLALFLPEGRIALSDTPFIRAERDTCLPDEGYTVSLQETGVRITHRDEAGLVHALATLSLLFEKREGRLFLPVGTIEDAPAFPHRGVMLDIGRGAPPIEEILDAILLAAKSKMNVVHLHLSDAKGLGVRLTSLPEQMILKSAYTRAQVEQITDLCKLFALELIPEFDLPAHSTALLSARPELHCQVPPEKVERLWCVCAGNEAVYELYEKIIREICEWFPDGRYFHIGGDELEFTDLQPRRLAFWDQCPRCKALTEREGLADKTEIYYHLMNRVNDLVKKQGRQTIMWSEQIDCSRPCTLSKDILMHFWRVAYPGRGPVEGCSMQRQLELGYTLINSHYPETYADLEKYMSPETLATWRPDERPDCTDQYKDKIVGSEVCLWEWGNADGFPFYNRTTASSILLMADKLWSGTKHPYKAAHRKALTRTLLGSGTPKELDVFEIVGSILPPRSQALCYSEKVTLTDEEKQALSALLSDKERFAGYEKYAELFLSILN